jgi:outer membrane protein assembly factor BamB
MKLRRFSCWLFGCALWGLVSLAARAEDAPAADPLDWPSWRGPEQNGISREVGLAYEWDLKGKNLLWRKPEFGTRSTPIVMRGKLYTLCRSEPETPREGERVVCLDAATGELLWENKFNVFLTDVPCERVGWSCVVGDPETGRVYALGVCGYFQCIDGETGQTLWSRSLSEEFGLVSTYGGRTNVPVIFEDLVIVSAVMTNWGEMAVPAHRFLAFDKMTGEPRWFNGTRLRPEDTTYSTPFLTVLAGQAAMVFGSSDGAVHAFQPRTGKPIWRYQLSPRGLNVSPVVDRGVVYIGQSEENRDDNTMGAVAAINGELEGDITETGERWRVKELMVGKSSPLVLGDRFYAADDANLLYVLDTRTGEVIARQKLLGTIMRASLLYADGHIFACTTSAWHVLEPTDDGVKIVHRLRFPQAEEIHGSPIVSHGRIYLPTTGALYCIGTPDAKPQAVPRPDPPQEAPPEERPQPAWLQLVPVDALIRPGEAVQFRARLFNARGQFLREVPASEVQFAADQGGQIDAEGRFTADSSAAHLGVTITAKLGELTGQARLRIVPPLPWHFDFDEAELTPNPMTKLPEGEPPLTWIGARYRHKIRKLDGQQVMVKVTTIPKGTRSQSWMGQPDLHDYTIQADLRGAIKDGKLPDMGVIAQRYSLELMGNAQELRIRSWTSQLNRFSKTIPFAWKHGVWYTMKFRASVENGAAVLRGKVWPRGDAEPRDWTIEAVDEAPNVVGSPGLFGNASDAEIYIDNISVIPN